MSADRAGCCETWPKPCSYHEGYADALDVSLPRDGELSVMLSFTKFGVIVTNYATAAEALRIVAASFDRKALETN